MLKWISHDITQCEISQHVLCSQDAEEIDGTRHQVEIGHNKSIIFRNNLEILFLDVFRTWK